MLSMLGLIVIKKKTHTHKRKEKNVTLLNGKRNEDYYLMICTRISITEDIFELFKVYMQEIMNQHVLIVYIAIEKKMY